MMAEDRSGIARRVEQGCGGRAAVWDAGLTRQTDQNDLWPPAM
jgi:hypothetical protein